MTSENSSSPEPPAGRKRREPPTIDLTATEIAEAEAAKAAATPELDSATEPPPQNGQHEKSARTRLRSAMPWIAASTVAAGLLVAIWFAGPFRPRDDVAMETKARLAQVELQLRDLAARPATATPDPKPAADLSAQLSRTESALSSRLAAAEAVAKQAADSLAALTRRIEETATMAREARGQAEAAAASASRNDPEAARAGLTTLANRLDAIERNLKSTDAELAKRIASDDRAGRLAIAALSLRGAVERGDPFASELAAVKSLAPDAKPLAPLAPYADTGLPSAATLSREFGKLMPAMQRAVAAPEGGFIDKLQQNAERLVRIRPIGDVPGDEPATVIGRIDLRIANNDIAGTLAELRKLPPPVRASAEDWARRAESRGAALESARQITASALAALSKTGS